MTMFESVNSVVSPEIDKYLMSLHFEYLADDSYLYRSRSRLLREIIAESRGREYKILQSIFYDRIRIETGLVITVEDIKDNITLDEFKLLCDKCIKNHINRL